MRGLQPMLTLVPTPIGFSGTRFVRGLQQNNKKLHIFPCFSGTRFVRGLQLYKSGKVFENSFSGTRFKGICITLMLLLVVSKFV